ncbi:MT-A70 family protein [[Leptolyngbya] sp. PCC 7376]|uniref:MT-A70 family methyltransferase n=1 Tax=[Leptolyngbya] sp. PCC 7376 TaxID=111781 RepID=UPI00029EE50E|nr:MT-A70 family methyltransferase [[Leptolyngbya] sp. PCC 7376]AFY39911.1 MT-A70 family protein [[Leptolyngbya] sp. PCC 7376]
MQQLLLDQPVVEGAQPFPAKAYGVIYADPPWQYEDKKKNRGGAERHYQTMSDHEIQNLPVSQIAENDSLLFLWATWAKLPAALQTIHCWGFTYKTEAFLWVKRNKRAKSLFMGMGSYTRANSEFCLLGVRGKGLKRKSAKVHQIIEAPIRRHSEKPPETRERIVELVGDRPRIELFARETVDGWDSWGDEL